MNMYWNAREGRGMLSNFLSRGAVNICYSLDLSQRKIKIPRDPFE